MKTVTATYVRNHIAETWEMAKVEPVFVECHGETKAVIISAEQYQTLKLG